jgi:hypothetical protein
MKFQLHRHLRLSIIVWRIVAWNALLGWSVLLNGGFGHTRVPAAAWPTAAALLATCCVCLLLIFSARAKAWAFRPDGDPSAVRIELAFIALLAGGLALGAFYSAFLSVPVA